MNAKANTTPAPTASEIEVRITDERRRLLADQNLQINLEGQRLAPLEAGDDAALNRVEKQLSESIERQERAQERIELLQKRLESTRASENEAADNVLVEQAIALRAEGVKLMSEAYPKAARAVAAVFEKMDQIDQQILVLNNQLNDTDKIVSYPNEDRTKPGYTAEEKVTAGSCSLESKQHPRHGTPTYFDPRKNSVCYADTKEPVYNHQLFITRTYEVAPVRQPFITNEANLPGIWPTKATQQ